MFNPVGGAYHEPVAAPNNPTTRAGTLRAERRRRERGILWLRFCATIACAVGAPVTATLGQGRGPPPHAESRPNIIVVIADDLGWADLGYRGSVIETPHIDSLAANGLRFEHFYAHAWCSPTRAAFYTGKFPAPSAWVLPGTNTPGVDGIDPEAYTLPERFRDAGYATALIGKWHQGTSSASHPNHNGFEYFYGMLGGYINYFLKVSYFGPHDWQRDGVEIFDELEYATTLLGEDAARYVRERDPSKPFFLTLSFNAPHFPQQAPVDLIEKYASISICLFLPNRCGYMAQVEVMDREIGRLLQTLEEEGIAGETLVVFLSDNGGASLFGGSNQPLRGEKGETYEGGIRVPAIMSWPGVLAAGEIRDQRVRVEDLYATLESAARLRRKAPRDGFDAWGAIVSGKSVPRGPMYFVNTTVERAQAEVRSRALIVKGWKLVSVDSRGIGGGVTTELFEIDDDPAESNDVAADNPHVVRLLERLLDLEDRMNPTSVPEMPLREGAAGFDRD